MNDFEGLLTGGIAALKEDRTEQAVSSFAAALRLRSRDAEALSLYGLALARAGRLDDAAAPLAQAVELEPAQLGFRLNLSEFYERCRRDGDAADELRRIVSHQPQFEIAWVRLVAALERIQDWSGLAAAGAAWLRIDPGNNQALCAIARGKYELGDVTGAKQAYDARRRNLPAAAEAQCSYGLCCLAAGDFAEAAVALDEAERLAPDDVDMLAGKARLLTYLGRFAEAEDYCRRCLERDARHVQAFTFLSQLTKGRLSEAEKRTLSGIAADIRAPLNQRAHAAFALARADDAAEDVDSAFARYCEANELAREQAAREGLIYDAARAEMRTRRIMELAAKPMQAREAGERPTPIFIVGMPRSGTTLIEGVLSAHSLVSGKGELSAMRLILQRWLDLHEPDAAQLDAWAHEYLTAALPVGAARYFTDKLPMNFEAAALIARLFPDAPIIHVRRSPLETTFSIFRQGLTKFLTYANRMEDIAHAYGQYARLMAHWQQTLGDRIATIQYEDFVASFDRSAPNLVEGCGLEWEEACRNFQNAPRAISTFSTVQVRDPLSLRTSVSRYAHHLGPLREALEREGVDIETGAWSPR